MFYTFKNYEDNEILSKEKTLFLDILRIWLTTRILKYILPDGAQTGHIGWQDYSLSHKQPLSN